MPFAVREFVLIWRESLNDQATAFSIRWPRYGAGLAFLEKIMRQQVRLRSTCPRDEFSL